MLKVQSWNRYEIVFIRVRNPFLPTNEKHISKERHIVTDLSSAHHNDDKDNFSNDDSVTGDLSIINVAIVHYIIASLEIYGLNDLDLI